MQVTNSRQSFGTEAASGNVFDRLGISPDEYYQQAVLANEGLVKPEEQARLRKARIAIAGCGGAGSTCLVTLVRMGIGRFHIADMDTFSVSNVHRQEGAMSSTVGTSKVETMKVMVQDIHPGAQVETFKDGVTVDNIDAFLHGVDAVVDAIDFYCVPAHRLLHKRARELGKTVFMAAPLGFGASEIIFGPQGMSFDRFFGFADGMSPYESLIRFFAGLALKNPSAAYCDFSNVSIADRRSMGIVPAVRLCASLVGTSVLSFLLGRNQIRVAPNYVVYDLYLHQHHRGRLLWGSAGPLQRLKVAAALKHFRTQATAANELW